ncbi:MULTISPECIES: anthranilate synthase component II [Chitinophagaceae]
MSKILVFDNYDSFTYNLVQLVERIIGKRIDVFRNDKIALEDVDNYDKVLLSPGPGVPEDAGLLLPLIKRYAPTKSILGVCLGEQAIGEAFGAKLTNLSEVFHGVATPVKTTNVESPLFSGLPERFEVGRYHSWVVDKDGFPDCLDITAVDDEGFIMGLQHKQYDVQGVQFHPESILTPEGEKILRNWLK